MGSFAIKIIAQKELKIIKWKQVADRFKELYHLDNNDKDERIFEIYSGKGTVDLEDESLLSDSYFIQKYHRFNSRGMKVNWTNILGMSYRIYSFFDYPRIFNRQLPFYYKTLSNFQLNEIEEKALKFGFGIEIEIYYQFKEYPREIGLFLVALAETVDGIIDTDIENGYA
jgi:hypothetical protein